MDCYNCEYKISSLCMAGHVMLEQEGDPDFCIDYGAKENTNVPGGDLYWNRFGNIALWDCTEAFDDYLIKRLPIPIRRFYHFTYEVIEDRVFSIEIVLAGFDQYSMLIEKFFSRIGSTDQQVRRKYGATAINTQVTTDEIGIKKCLSLIINYQGLSLKKEK